MVKRAVPVVRVGARKPRKLHGLNVSEHLMLYRVTKELQDSKAIPI